MINNMLNQRDKHIITVENLTKKFNNFTAVDNISFTVAEGEVFAFLGHNGAGKSTTIKMLTTLLTPTSGKIKINGYDPIKEQHQTRQSFGIVFQDQSLDDQLTAQENMEFHAVLYKVGKEERKEKIKELLSMVKLWDRKDNLVKTFSGGMKRRLEIARGLLHTPKILFLDEPTLGLDPQTRNQIWTYILNKNKQEKVTVFFTTHYMDEAEKMSNRIAIINQGRIIADGTAQELRAKTKTNSLEEGFLTLTGCEIKEKSANSIDQMRMASRLYKR